MRRLQPSHLLTAAVLVLGTLAAVHVVVAERQVNTIRWAEVAAFAGVAILLSCRHIDLVVRTDKIKRDGMSLAFAAAFVAMMRCGPLPALAIHVAATAVGTACASRRSMGAVAYGTSLAAVEIVCASHLYHAASGGAWVLWSAIDLPAALAAAFTMFAVHSSGCALLLALRLKERPGTVWRQCFLWMAPGYVGLAFVSALPSLFHDHFVSGLAAMALPFGFVTYHSIRAFTAQAADGEVHIRQLERNQSQLEDLYLATIKSLALAIDAKDQYTHQHILRVQRYATAIAEVLGISGNEMEAVRTGALLHDIGKLGIPEHVLLKPGRLTEEEFAKVKKHPTIGAAILDPVDFPWPVLPVVKCHHEKWDGSGYPLGLKEHEIPLTARILAVADVYDALTSTRSYRDAWPHGKAVEEIKRSSGSHFDPAIVVAFLKVIDGVVTEMAAEGHGPLAGNNTDSAQSLTPIAKQAVDDIRKASGELWALYEVAQSLTTGLGAKATLEILAPKLEALLPDTAWVILLQDPDSDHLIVQTAVGLNREFFSGSRTYNLLSVSSIVARTRKPYVGNYDQDDLLITSSKETEWTRLRSSVVLPLIHQGHVLGTVNVYRQEANAFRQDEITLLETIAERTSSALYNGVLYDRAQNSALTDPLTGLYNIRYLTEQVEKRCEKWRSGLGKDSSAAPPQCRAEDRFSLLCLDLDMFKPINDNFGHQKGDQVLRDLAKIFRSAVRDKDVVARYGGDEFIVVLDGADRAAAEAMVDRLQHAVEQYNPRLNHNKLGSLRVGVSIGAACFPEDGQSCTALLTTADAQMYAEKTERKLTRLAPFGQPSSTPEEEPSTELNPLKRAA